MTNRHPSGTPVGGQFAPGTSAAPAPGVHLGVAVADPYVIVSGGLVTNDPALPVLDLDLLDASDPDGDTYVAVDELRAAAEALGCEYVRKAAAAWLADEQPHIEPDGFEPAGLPVFDDVPSGAGDPYVMFEGGLVQNSPAIAILDTDILEHESPDADTRAEVQTLHDLATEVGHQQIADEAQEWLAQYDHDHPAEQAAAAPTTPEELR